MARLSGQTFLGELAPGVVSNHVPLGGSHLVSVPPAQTHSKFPPAEFLATGVIYLFIPADRLCLPSPRHCTQPQAVPGRSQLFQIEAAMGKQLPCLLQMSLVKSSVESTGQWTNTWKFWRTFQLSLSGFSPVSSPHGLVPSPLFVEHLRCARHLPATVKKPKTNQPTPCPHGAYILEGETDK